MSPATAAWLAALGAVFALLMGLTGRLVWRHSGRVPRHRFNRPGPRRDRLRHLITVKRRPR